MSDMYLDRDTVNKILESNGYHVDSLFISSEYDETKGSGKLFKRVMKDKGISDPSLICHIGDNPNSDVARPRELGIIAFHLPRPVNVLNGFDENHGHLLKKVINRPNPYINTPKVFSQYLGNRCAWAIVANRIFDNPFAPFKIESDFGMNPYFVGYCALGMHLFALSRWMMDNEKGKDRTLHFISRDGYLLKRCYDRCVKDLNGYKTNYLYASRRSLLLAGIKNPSDMYSIPFKVNSDSLRIGQLLEMVSYLFDESAQADLSDKIVSKYGSLDTPIGTLERMLEIISFIVENYKDKMDFQKSEANLKKALSSVSTGDAIFDIGYSGRTEEAISAVIGSPIDSYYVYIEKGIEHQRSLNSGFHTDSFYDYIPTVPGLIREHMMMELGPSTIGYDDGKPIFDNYSSSHSSNTITRIIQDAAFDFVEDINVLFNEKISQLFFNYHEMSMPFEFYLHESMINDKSILSSIEFEDTLGKGEKIDYLNIWNESISITNQNKAGNVRMEQNAITVNVITDAVKKRFSNPDGILCRLAVRSVFLLYRVYSKLSF